LWRRVNSFAKAIAFFLTGRVLHFLRERRYCIDFSGGLRDYLRLLIKGFAKRETVQGLT